MDRNNRREVSLTVPRLNDVYKCLCQDNGNPQNHALFAFFVLRFMKTGYKIKSQLKAAFGGMEDFMEKGLKISVSQKAYDDYVKESGSGTIKNERISPPDVHFLDAIMSPEADLTKTPEGRRFIETLKAL
jgi:hypothetical protein